MIKLFIDLNSNTIYLSQNSADESFDFEVHVLADPGQKVKNFNFDFYLQCDLPEIQTLLVEENIPFEANDQAILNGSGIFARRKYSNLVSGKTYNLIVFATNLRKVFEKTMPIRIL